MSSFYKNFIGIFIHKVSKKNLSRLNSQWMSKMTLYSLWKSESGDCQLDSKEIHFRIRKQLFSVCVYVLVYVWSCVVVVNISVC